MKQKKILQIIQVAIPCAILILCSIGFLWAPNDPNCANLLTRFAKPSPDYLFGTDHLGRCILSRILYGGKTTLGIVIGGSVVIFVIGTLFGMALSKGIMKVNVMLDSLINAVTAIPPIAYLIIFIGAWGNGARTMLFAMTISYILRYIKLIRTRTDIEMDKAYVMCAIASGASKIRIMVVHILPNLISEMIQFLCLSSADMILTITGFSFIGLGLGDNVVDWGSMILDARSVIVMHPTIVLYPMFFVLLSALSFNILGKKITVH